MTRVHIYGAGSIGNHLAHACRGKNWSVAMTDRDPAALRRTREDIYPARYGQWDSAIEMVPDAAFSGPADLAIIGTPPDTHMALAAEVLQHRPPKVLLIEKPLCTPDLAGSRDVARLAEETKTIVLTGYNHALTQNTKVAERILQAGAIGTPLFMSVRWLEHWGGIFGAHPWLNGPADSYLGFSARGGGACGEHSHGIHLFQHMAQHLGLGDIEEVSGTLDRVRASGVDYDRVGLLNVRTAGGLVGSIAQDVVTRPAVKTLRIQGEEGFLEWVASYDAGHDAVIWAGRNQAGETVRIPRTRPDDFVGEIDEIDRILRGESAGDAISLARGFNTMRVIAAAWRSHEEGRMCRLADIG